MNEFFYRQIAFEQGKNLFFMVGQFLGWRFCPLPLRLQLVKQSSVHSSLDFKGRHCSELDRKTFWYFF